MAHELLLSSSKHKQRLREDDARTTEIIKIGVVMLNKRLKKLSADIYLKCFVCNEHEARHLCIFECNGLNFKLCLCPQCVSSSGQRPDTDLLQKVA
jgi:hypothetical protein